MLLVVLPCGIFYLARSHKLSNIRIAYKNAEASSRQRFSHVFRLVKDGNEFTNNILN